jgi:hypothetical protein
MLLERGIIALTVFCAWLIGIGTWIGLIRVSRVSFLLSAFAVLAVTLWLQRKSLPRRLPRWETPNFSGLTGFTIGVSAFMMITVVALAVYFPPTTYDEVFYHLPAVIEWWQKGRIFWIDSWILYTNSYPLNTELVSLWIMSLSGDILIELGQLPFVLLGALACYALVVALGGSGQSASLALAAFLLCPTIVAQLRSMYVDAAFAGLVLCGAFYVSRYVQTGFLPQYGLCIAIIAGLALGSKSAGIVTAALLMSIILVGLILRFRAVKPIICYGGAAVVLLVLLGSFWYLRNAIYRGNPLYPFIISVGGTKVFDGVATVEDAVISFSVPPEYRDRPTWQRILSSWLEEERLYHYGTARGGFGPAWFWFILPSLVAVTVASALRRQWILPLLCAYFVVQFLLQPNNWWARYTLGFYGFGCVCLGLLISQMPRRLAVVTHLVVLIPLVVGASVALAVLSAQVPWLVGRPGQAMPAPATLAELWADYGWLKEADGVTIAYGYAVPYLYPLYGPKLSNQLLYLGGQPSDLIERFLSSPADFLVLMPDQVPLATWKRDRRLTLVHESKFIAVFKRGQ